MPLFFVHLDYRGLSKRIQDALVSMMQERHPTDPAAGIYAYCMQITKVLMQEVRAQKIPEDDPWPDVLRIAEQLATTDPDISTDEDAVALLRDLR